MIVGIPFAHLGHWYVQLAFALPAILILAVMGRDSLRRRWRRRRGQDPPPKGRKPREAPRSTSKKPR